MVTFLYVYDTLSLGAYERENEIYLEYPEYYEDERILEEEEKWLEEFLNQLPEKKREYFEKLIKES